VAEEFDVASAVPDPAVGPATAAFSKVMHARRPMDTSYGRKLVGQLSLQPRQDIGADARACVWRGGTEPWLRGDSPSSSSDRSWSTMGELSADEFDEALSVLDRPHVVALSQLMVSAWGRRGESDSQP